MVFGPLLRTIDLSNLFRVVEVVGSILPNQQTWDTL